MIIRMDLCSIIGVLGITEGNDFSGILLFIRIGILSFSFIVCRFVFVGIMRMVRFGGVVCTVVCGISFLFLG